MRFGEGMDGGQLFTNREGKGAQKFISFSFLSVFVADKY